MEGMCKNNKPADGKKRIEGDEAIEFLMRNQNGGSGAL